MILLFVYGTLKRGGSLSANMEGSRFVCEDTLPNCNLYMLDWYPALKEHISRPDSSNNNEGQQSRVHGEVYDITEDMLRHMDTVENVSEGLYKREQIRTTKGNLVWVYIYLRQVDETQRIESGRFDVSIPRDGDV